MSGAACAKIIINQAAKAQTLEFTNCQETFEALMGIPGAVNDGDMAKAGAIDKNVEKVLARACEEYDLLNQAIADRA